MDRNDFFARFKKTAKVITFDIDALVVVSEDEVDQAEEEGRPLLRCRKLRQKEVEHLTKNYGPKNEDKALEGLRYVIASTAVTKDGEPFFVLGDKDKELAAIDYDVAELLATEVMGFSGLDIGKKKGKKDAQAEAEEAAKNE